MPGGIAHRWRGWLCAALGIAALNGLAACRVAAQTAERGVLVFTGPAGAGGPQRVEVYAKSYALVIGIDAYTDPAWPRLRNAVGDARKVAEALARHGFEVTPRYNLKSAELEPALRDFFIHQGADPKARLVVWFAGHGHTLSLHGSEEGFLVPADAPSPANATAFRARALSLELFRFYFKQASAKHVLAVFDSCFSGSVLDITREAELSAPPDIAALAGGTARQMIASGDRGQKVSDDGTFQRLFVDALSGAVPGLGARGYVTGQELGWYLRREVAQLTARKANPQTPQAGYLNAAGMNRGDVVFEIVAPDGTRVRAVDAATPVAPSPPQPGWSTAEREWQQYGKESRDTALLEAFKRKHKDDPVYVALADARLVLLRREEQAVAAEQKLAAVQTPTPAPAKRPPAKAVPPTAPAIGETFRDCTDCPEMVVVPAGDYLQGDETRPVDGINRRKVTIGKPFAVGKFEVTRGQFAAFVAATKHKTDGGCYALAGTEWKLQADKSWRDPGFAQDDTHPVACVSWSDAKAYVAWLAGQTTQPYRLLTEAEWEYAARAGTTTAYSFGDKITKAQAQFSEGQWGSAKQTVEVGKFPANAFGLHDMHGNVWEWVEDCWNANYQGAPASEAARTTGECSRRVLRGGSWLSYPGDLRSAYRGWNSTDNRSGYLGFRLGRTLTP